MSAAYRPVYHFLPPAGWMNDPNGLIHWQGRYHMFYQHNPAEARHGQIVWGHATSFDLLTWTHEPVALRPTPGGPDADGCWSGCAVDDHGTPTLIYSGHRQDHQFEAPCMATSHDDLRTWFKDPAHALFAPPAEPDLRAMRDHCVWPEAGGWSMLMGAGLHGRGGAVLRFWSPDLRTWDYTGPLLVATDLEPALGWTGSIWECPDLFPLGDRHALSLSIWEDEPHHSLLLLGNYREGRFWPTQAQKFDYGDRLWYAPQSFRDAHGRRIVLGWIAEARSESAQHAAGWAGVMSLPRLVGCDAAGRVTISPIPEVSQLRHDEVRLGPLVVPPATIIPLAASGAALELALEAQMPEHGRLGLAVRRSPDGSEVTWLWYDQATQTLSLDRSQASHDPATERTAHHAPLLLDPGDHLRLRIFLDHSVLEIFANDRVALTSRIYPSMADSLGLALAAEGSAVVCSTVTVWRIGAA